MRLTIAFFIVVLMEPDLPHGGTGRVPSFSAPLLASSASSSQRIEEIQVVQGPRPGIAPPVRDPSLLDRAPAGSGVVQGVVVSADGGRPVRRASVRLSGSVPGPPLTTVADEQGRFTFEGVPAGRFTLVASKPGYLDSIYGQRRPGSGRPGTPLSLADGQRVERLTLPLARGGVLAGTVTDDAGEPAFGTQVQAHRFTWESGEKTSRLVAAVTADDRGQFRIGALPPGEYLVLATPSESPVMFDRVQAPIAMMPGMMGGVFAGTSVALSETGVIGEASGGSFAPVFYPGTLTSRDATVISLGVSEERAGLDVQLPFIRSGALAGVVTHLGQPVPGVAVHLENIDDAVANTGGRAAVTSPDGSFLFSKLPPGQYRVTALMGSNRRVQVDQENGQTRVMMQFTNVAPGDGAPPPDPSTVAMSQPRQLWAGADIAIAGGETQRLSMTLDSGTTLTGRIVLDGSGPPPPSLAGITVVLAPASPTASGSGSGFARVEADGRFTIFNVVPGRYRPTVLAGAWRARRFDVQGIDALDAPLEIQPNRPPGEATVTMTTRMSTLAGTITDTSGKPAPEYTLIVFSEDQAYWTPRSRRVVSTRPATDGRFTVGDLPAGRYRLAAVEDVEEGQWYDPAYLTQLVNAGIPIDIQESATVTQDVRVAR